MNIVDYFLGKITSNAFKRGFYEGGKVTNANKDFWNANSDFETTAVIDRDRLKQVLSNIIGNAIKFTNEGHVEFGYELEGKRNLKFYVKDTGIGISKENLNKIFKEAEESNAILFFDEADALFGKRSEVRDSHDRYANIEVSYLLQKMEENEGIVILASNLCRNIDDAFMRRMYYTIEFPFPEEESRHKIWKSMFPNDAPLSEDVDFEFLAGRFRLSGGNIKNIVVNAAFLAAENSGAITMEDMIKAAKREFQKIGKICSESEFGEYYDLVSD